MFPKVTTLPLGVPMPRMVSVLRGFDPHVCIGFAGAPRIRRAASGALVGVRRWPCIKPTYRVSRRATAFR